MNTSPKDRLDSTLSTGPVVTCLKTLMMVFNVIFWMTGIVILAIGIWTKVDLFKYLELSSVYQAHVPYVLIGIGAVIVLVGCLGCCCIIKGNALLLYLFSGFLFFVFIVNVSCGIAVLIYRGKVEEGFKEGLSNAMKKYDANKKNEITRAMDFLQDKLKCCGIQNYSNWFETPYAKAEDNKNSVPASCCRKAPCQHNTLPKDKALIAKEIHPQGCHKLVVDFINSNMAPIGGVALGVAFFQALGALLACCLAKNINKAKYETVS
ncbi:tetraspanin [Plakobranchus ocellatus]|uniref:Tetraspanin n=1 Tax=Plakobranchus ocellatus TaxID=259542 RepID=A0AAV4C9V5_9GAST|nr:tetraspanin [Plakobranchus ocellatus]